MPRESSPGPADPATARQVREYLAQLEEQRKRWIHRQRTDRRNQTWKGEFIAASHVYATDCIQVSGGSLRPPDGTFFSGPSAKASERRAESLEKTILDYVAARDEPPEDGTTLTDYAAEAISSRVATDLRDLGLLAIRGDTKALEAYAQFAREMVATLNCLPKERKKQLRPWASGRLNWPVLMGRSSLYSEDVTSILSDLAVGTSLPFSQAAIGRLRGTPKAC